MGEGRVGETDPSEDSLSDENEPCDVRWAAKNLFVKLYLLNFHYYFITPSIIFLLYYFIKRRRILERV